MEGSDGRLFPRLQELDLNGGEDECGGPDEAVEQDGLGRIVLFSVSTAISPQFP